MYVYFCIMSSVQSVSMYCPYVNCFLFFCTVWSTLIRISLTKALVLWWCDNKSDLIWFKYSFVCLLKDNLLYLHSAFLSTQSASHRRGESPQPPPMCSIHTGWCAGSHIVPERPPHTSLLVERRQNDEANQCMGMIRLEDDLKKVQSRKVDCQVATRV